METENPAAGVIGLISTIRDKANNYILLKLKERGIKDIVPAHGAIFVALFKNHELPMGQIAQMIDRDKSTVTTLVNRLMSLGYLEKRKDDCDSRISLISLTEKGKSLKTDFMNISEDLLSSVYDGFSELEKDIIMKLLTRIKDHL